MRHSYEQARLGTTTVGDVARNKLRALCAALDWNDEARAEEALAPLVDSFAQESLEFAPRWSTDLTDDGTPFEFSIAFGAQVELRMLAEPQADPFNLASNWAAANRVNRALSARVGVSLERLNQIASLFEPHAGSRARFAMWHAASLVDRANATTFKVYLNPQIHGPSRASELVEEAMRRLEMHEAWQFVAARTRSADRWLYLSLDLSSESRARVKLYTAHEHWAVGQIEDLFTDTRHYRKGNVARWLHTVLGDVSYSDGNTRPLLSCTSFSEKDKPHATLHMPVRCYVTDDEQALQRASALLDGDLAERLERTVRNWAARPLDAGRGLITYISCRDETTGTRVTTYLAPQLYSIAAARQIRAPLHSIVRQLAASEPNSLTMEAMRESIERHRLVLARHPFIQRLESPGSLDAVRAMAPRLTFFVLAFQDILRLARTHSAGGAMASLTLAHEAEDRGHEQWFLNDLEVLGATRDLRWVFSPAHAATRDVSYALVCEVLRARDDRARVAVLLALEAAGSEFFGRTIAYLERLGRGENLLYFARQHQHIEQNHSVFEAEEQRRLWASSLPAEAYCEVISAVDRTFECMMQLANDLDAAMAGADVTQVAS